MTEKEERRVGYWGRDNIAVGAALGGVLHLEAAPPGSTALCNGKTRSRTLPADDARDRGAQGVQTTSSRSQAYADLRRVGLAPGCLGDALCILPMPPDRAGRTEQLAHGLDAGARYTYPTRAAQPEEHRASLPLLQHPQAQQGAGCLPAACALRSIPADACRPPVP